MVKLLDRLFLFMVARETLLVLGVGLVVAMVPMVLEQLHFVRGGWHSGAAVHGEELEDIERVVDGVAGILVAGGVFLESRETLRKLARKRADDEPTQLVLNEIAHHNGMGLLLIGLFMEIGTALIGLPERVVNLSGIERPIFAVCLALNLGALVVLLDFVKDYGKTYFGGASEGAHS